MTKYLDYFQSKYPKVLFKCSVDYVKSPYNDIGAKEVPGKKVLVPKVVPPLVH